MYIAVILENYSQATEDVQEGLTDDDYVRAHHMFSRILNFLFIIEFFFPDKNCLSDENNSRIAIL